MVHVGRSSGRCLLAAASLAGCMQAWARVTGASSGMKGPSSGMQGGLAARVDQRQAAWTASESKKYLVASFPSVRAVGYLHLPDNVWRPLVIGKVVRPESVAIDSQRSRLFVADPPQGVIFWYSLKVREKDRLLKTDSMRHVAVEGYRADALAVSTDGDLYFTGRAMATPSSNNSIFRQDVRKIQRHKSKNPVEVYARFNTGNPLPMAYAPSGLSVDSFHIYWGNQQRGKTFGSMVKASRKNLGQRSQDLVLNKLAQNVDQVRGVEATGTHIFFLSSLGLHGVMKTQPTTVKNPDHGLVAPPTMGTWDPTDLSWDGENTLYLVNRGEACLYTVPSLDAMGHNLTRFADAPRAHGVSILNIPSDGAHRGDALRALSLLAVLVALRGSA